MTESAVAVTTTTTNTEIVIDRTVCASRVVRRRFGRGGGWRGFSVAGTHGEIERRPARSHYAAQADERVQGINDKVEPEETYRIQHRKRREHRDDEAYSASDLRV